MPRFTKRYWLVLALVLACMLALLFVGRRLNATKRGGQQPAEPFRIAGNLYYVGANDVSAFLLTGPDGHIVLDGGYPTTARMIMASIAKLGFDIKDVKVLLNSEPHPDHAGGLAFFPQAEVVVARIRDSANARSSGIDGFRWWQTISMSRCSSIVFTVNGIVGFVDDGRQFASPATRMMSGSPGFVNTWIRSPLSASDLSSFLKVP